MSLNFNDPALLMANISTHNYLKAKKIQQERKEIDEIKGFYESEKFMNTKDFFYSIVKELLESPIEETHLQQLFISFYKECIHYYEQREKITTNLTANEQNDQKEISNQTNEQNEQIDISNQDMFNISNIEI